MGKRKAASKDDGDDELAGGSNQARVASTGDDPVANRRQVQADIARRRAAHFATYQVGDEDTDQANNPHVGGDTARTLGPWSSAVALANARENAQNKRKEKILDDNRPTTDTNKTIWKPSRDIALDPRPQCNVKSLLDITLELLADYIEDVESLYGLPDVVKSWIAATVCRQRAMSPLAFQLFCMHQPTEVSILDCTLIEPAMMQTGLQEAMTPRLVQLHLGHCGRGFSDATATSLASSSPILSSLQSLSLKGAYRLGDEALEKLLKKAPELRELVLSHSSRLTGAGVVVLPNLAPKLEYLDLSDCRGVDRESLKTIVAGLPCLRSVKLNGINDVDDSLIASLVEINPNLEDISLNRCYNITDAALASLSTCKSLQAIWLDECKITNNGIQTLSENCRTIRRISLQRCTAIDDAGIIPMVESLGNSIQLVNLNGLVNITDAALVAMADACSSSLEELDVSWCRRVSESALGLVADSCSGLKRLIVWGNSHVEKEFLHGHSNNRLEVVGRGEQTIQITLPLKN